MSVATERTLFPSTQMDHEWFSFSAFPERRPLRWPNNARVALWIVPALEFLDVIPPDSASQWPPAQAALDVRTWSHRDYGNRVGIWRVMEVLDKYGLRATAAVNAIICERYPDIIEESLKRGWEIMAHGELNSRMITSKMPVEEEREVIARSRDAITRATGKAPAGWLAPQLGESSNTPGLLAEAGFTYTADWCNDDQPYRLRVPQGRLTAVPYSIEVNDQVLIFQQNHPAWVWEQIGRDHFDHLYAEGATTGMVVCIALHPYCIGQPLRIKYLDGLLAHITSHAGVWNATGNEIAEYYNANYPA